jgi:hypothetical protein
MHVRNALAVLEKIISYYPQVDFHGSILEEKVNLIASKSETRGDLQIRALGYLALLQKSSKSLVTAAKFGAQNKPTMSPRYSSIEKQYLDKPRSNLNPAAPSFKPQDDGYR